MTAATWERNQPLRRAFGASVALHVLLALLIPTYIVQQSGALEPIETLSFAKIIHIRLQRPEVTRTLPVAIPKTAHRARVTFGRVRSELSVHSTRPAIRPKPQTGPRGALAAAPKPVTESSAPLYAQPPRQEALNSVRPQHAQATAAPAPQSSVAPLDVSGTGTSDRGGVLPFGAQQSPALDAAARAQLEKLGVRVTLIVTVGDDGHVKNVVFQPPIDAATERAIHTILAKANWDAAVCGGGVSCEGVATIKL